MGVVLGGVVSAPAQVVWFVVPEGFDDPDRVSGGNVYDRRVGAELNVLGWDMRVVQVGAAASSGADALARIPDGGLALVDGLVAIGAPAAVAAAADRLRLVAVVHMLAEAFADPDPRTIDGQRRTLPRARRVIAVSRWLRDELVRRGLSAPEHVVVATPGSDEAAPATGTRSGGSLLCVGAVAPHKGQDTLVEALAALGAGAGWTCTFAGSAAVDPRFAARVSAEAAGAGLSERIAWAGVLSASDLDDAYSGADVLIAPSRTESYGIAIGDALRRGIPVIASDVGGIPEAVGAGGAGLLVPPHDARALADALRQWISDPALRARMAAAARRAAPSRPRWSDTARTVHDTLVGLS